MTPTTYFSEKITTPPISPMIHRLGGWYNKAADSSGVSIESDTSPAGDSINSDEQGVSPKQRVSPKHADLIPGVSLPRWFELLKSQDCSRLETKIKKENSCSLSNAKMICEVGGILAKHDVLWWLQFGSLLSVIRDKSFNTPDQDHDIGVSIADYQRYFTPKSLLPNLIEVDLLANGYRLEGWGKIMPFEKGIADSFGCPLEIDMWPMCFNASDGRLPPPQNIKDAAFGASKVYYCDCAQEMSYDYRHFLREKDGSLVSQLRQQVVEGVMVPIPDEPDALLKQIYGEWHKQGDAKANDACPANP